MHEVRHGGVDESVHRVHADDRNERCGLVHCPVYPLVDCGDDGGLNSGVAPSWRHRIDKTLVFSISSRDQMITGVTAVRTKATSTSKAGTPVRAGMPFAAPLAGSASYPPFGWPVGAYTPVMPRKVGRDAEEDLRTAFRISECPTTRFSIDLASESERM